MDETLKLQDEIQEIISDIDDATVNEVCNKLKTNLSEIGLPVVIRYIIFYSAINYRKVRTYVSLVQNMINIDGFTECLESNLYYGYTCRANKLISSLCELDLIGYDKSEYYKERFIRNRKNRSIYFQKPRFNEEIYNIIKLIKYDDVDSVQKITSQIGFDKNMYINIDSLKPFVHKDKYVHIPELRFINISAFFGSVQCFKYFILNGFELNKFSFICAIYGGEPEIIHSIEHKGFSVKKEDLIYSIPNHHHDIFDWIVEKFPDSLTKDVLRICIRSDFVHGILRYPSSQWFNDYSDSLINFHLMKMANNHGIYAYKSAISMLLLDDISIYKNQLICSLNIACEFGHIEIVKSLLAEENSHLVSQVGENNNLLLRACKQNHVELVEYLLSFPGVDVNAVVNKEFECPLCPLIIATHHNDCQILEMLLEREEIDVNQECKNEEFSTALKHAASLGNIEAVKLLTSHKDIDINKLGYSYQIYGVIF